MLFEDFIKKYRKAPVEEFPAIITVANGINLYDEIRQK